MYSKVATRRDHRGPPTGGSGGQGGSVYVQVDERVQSLSDVPRVVNGNRGLHGSGDCQGGRKGDAIVVSEGAVYEVFELWRVEKAS